MNIYPLVLALMAWCSGQFAWLDAAQGRKPHLMTVATVSVSPDSMTLNVGESGAATCYPRNKQGTLLTNTCNWVSLDTTVATVTTGSQTASITAKKGGRISVYAGSNGKRDTTWVTVVDTVIPSPVADTMLPTPLRTVNVANTAQLDAAMAAAVPGDRIVMASGAYTEPDYGSGISRSGTPANPIVLTGPRTAVITGELLFRSASYWIVDGIRITNPVNIGVSLELGNFNIYQRLELDHMGLVGITIKTGAPGSHATGISRGNEVRYNYIHDTGIGGTPQWGEGVYVGDGYGDQKVIGSHVHHNTIGPNVTADVIELKVSADSSLVEFNTIIGLQAGLTVRSNNNVVNDNTISGLNKGYWLIGVGSDVAGTPASNNVFHRNKGSNETKLFFVADASAAVNTKVYCDNTVTAPMVLGVGCVQ